MSNSQRVLLERIDEIFSSEMLKLTMSLTKTELNQQTEILLYYNTSKHVRLRKRVECIL
jgi:hypothetical protein